MKLAGPQLPLTDKPPADDARLRARPASLLARFALETILILIVLFLLYLIFGSEEVIGRKVSIIQILINKYDNDEFRTAAYWLLVRLTVFGVSITAFFALVYYATSFEVTPIRLVLVPLLKFLRIWKTWPADFARAAKTGYKDEMENSDLIVVSERESVEGLPEKQLQESSAQAKVAEYQASTAMIYRVLRDSAEAAAKLAEKMEKRINAHLIYGLFTGAVGLGVWYYSFFLGKEAANPTALSSTQILWQFVPRITILIFIELLAGFFLRQYRIGVEDFKYFLELKRRAEAGRIAYTVFDLLGDDKSKLKFASGLLGEKSDIHIKKGETTTILEAMKSEENMTLKLIGVLSDHMESLTKLAHKGNQK